MNPPPLPPSVTLNDILSSQPRDHAIDVKDQSSPVQIQFVQRRERAQSKSFTFHNVQPQSSRYEAAIPLYESHDSDDDIDIPLHEHVMVLATPRSLTKSMTSEYSMRPTPLMENDRHTTMMSSLLKMGFDPVISEAALNQVNWLSVESAVDAAFLLQEEAAERRAEMLQQQTVDGEEYDDSTWTINPDAFEALEMKEEDEKEDRRRSITVTMDSPSPRSPKALTVNIDDEHQLQLTLPRISPRRWTCTVCTLINSFENKHCEMCGTKSPYANGPPPLPTNLPSTKPVPYRHSPVNTAPSPDGLPSVDDSSSAPPNCMICLENVPTSELVKARCAHTFCKECWRGYLHSKIADGAVVNILCPDPRCKRKVEAEEIKSHVSAEMYPKYVKFAENAKISMDPNARWCATPGCESVMTGSRMRPKMTCKKCKHSMCWSCNEPWHIGSCENAANRAMSAYRRTHDCKPCPKCGVIIERFEGCSHVTCTRCKHEFCWLCSQKYTKHHFALWNIAGCSGLQDGSLSWIGNDTCFCCSCGLGCGFAGKLKRVLFRIWVIFSFGLTILICTIPVALFGLLCAPCVMACWKRRKRQHAEQERRQRAERDARRERRRQRALARAADVDEQGNPLSPNTRRKRAQERAAAQEEKDIAEAIKRSQGIDSADHVIISVATSSPPPQGQVVPIKSRSDDVKTLADLTRENLVRVHED